MLAAGIVELVQHSWHNLQLAWLGLELVLVLDLNDDVPFSLL